MFGADGRVVGTGSRIPSLTAGAVRAGLVDAGFSESHCVPWVLPELPNLEELLRDLVRQVPPGRVTTFGDLATALGEVRAARWVAEAIADGDVTLADAPVHRVVRKSGELTGAVADQEQMLRGEGCPVHDRHVQITAARFVVTSSVQPLRRLSEWQLRMAAAADPTSAIDVPQTIGGVDLSYVSPREAVAAYVSVDVSSGTVRFSESIRQVVRFPYITGYLTFREAPVLLELLNAVRRKQALDPVILVDGTGRLHPRRAGIAVALGLLAGCTTVGVSKHQLCGSVTSMEVERGLAIEERGDLVGALLAGGSKRRTLFVSPGFGIDLASAVRCTRAVWSRERLPLPTFHADRLSRAAARAILTAASGIKNTPTPGSTR